ncbi:TIGR01777 family oxidoreductase [Nocardioides sp. YIM B13467]|uniref:TIGR01777 family oxidoreductase n=1 Tax=Nocardioides sp. YIM B13467 TaxID=3366294 RepID=UPI00366AD995
MAVTGSSGTVGRALVPFLTTGGHRVIRLVRHAPAGEDEHGRSGARGDQRRWDPSAPGPDLLDGVDAVVHLAGASIAGRFTAAHKTAIRDSRIEPTRRLAETAARSGVRTFVSASAIGIYGADRGDEVLTEASARGTGFLADVVADWEAASRVDGPRVAQVRTGIVQTPAGGALRLQRPLFAAGLGGRLGSGEQWLSWIGIDDLVDVYHRALLDETLVGPVNAVAPEPVNGRVYAQTLAHVLHRPALLPTPTLGPRLLLGKEGAEEMALASQRVEPAALGSQHQFRHPTLEAALRHVLGR